jgi:hypothetical protein
MTTMAMEEARHSTDGDLVRLLDDEAGFGDAQVAAHVNACAACRSRLESLRRRSTLFSEMLAAADPPPVDPPRVRPPFDQLALARASRRPRRAIWSHAGLRAAAGILLVAGVAAATPARTWILERVARLRGAVERDRGAIVQALTPRPDSTPSSAVFFTVASDVLVIRLEARQAAGTLELIAGREPRSSAQVLRGASGEVLLVLPSELRIRNTSRSVASYRIVLSVDIRRVRVDAGGDRAGETSFDVTPETRRVISLGRAGAAAR